MICLPAPGSSIPFSRPVPVHVMKTYRERSTAPLILHLGTRWMKVVSLTLRPALFRGENSGTHWTGGWAFWRRGKSLLSDSPARDLFTIPSAHPDSYIFGIPGKCSWRRAWTWFCSPSHIAVYVTSTLYRKNKIIESIRGQVMWGNRKREGNDVSRRIIILIFVLLG